ncbi:MAG: hypothetical protein AAB425_04520, partial [Bdellovibrionota bacterium]
RVFSGAGHFTSSAMQSNYENFYVTQDTELTAKYRKLFESMFPQAKTHKELIQIYGAAGIKVE